MTRAQTNPTGRRQLVQEVIRELRALSSEMDGLDQAVADRYGLNRTDMRCVDILGMRGPMQPKDLAEAMGFTTGGITTVIDRLEESGYAYRRQDPYDRRKVLVEPTQLASKQGQPIYGALGKRFDDLMAEAPDDSLTIIRDFLQLSQGVLKDHTRTVRAATAKNLLRPR
jgi:DNA-binding MarR family transcriptional regulator